MQYVQNRFTWDNAQDDNAVFIGYHDPLRRWNGWACPYFEREEVDRIIAYDQTLPNNPNEWYWEGDTLVWIEKSFDEVQPVRETFEATHIVVNGERKKVWPVGFMYWTWWEID